MGEDGAGPSLAVAEARCAPQSGLSNTEAFLYGGMIGLAYNSVKNNNRTSACMATYGWTQQRGKKPGKAMVARKNNFSSK